MACIFFPGQTRVTLLHHGGYSAGSFPHRGELERHGAGSARIAQELIQAHTRGKVLNVAGANQDVLDAFPL